MRPHPSNEDKGLIVLGCLWVIILIAVLCFCGCTTREKCERLYPPQVSEKIVTRDSIVCMPDTIYLPEQTLGLDIEAPLPPSFEYHKEEHRDHLSARVDISGGKISVRCREDSLRQVIERQTHYISTLDERQKVRIQKEYVTHWYTGIANFLAILFLIALAFMVGHLVYLKKFF